MQMYKLKCWCFRVFFFFLSLPKCKPAQTAVSSRTEPQVLFTCLFILMLAVAHLTATSGLTRSCDASTTWSCEFSSTRVFRLDLVSETSFRPLVLLPAFSFSVSSLWRISPTYLPTFPLSWWEHSFLKVAHICATEPRFSFNINWFHARVLPSINRTSLHLLLRYAPALPLLPSSTASDPPPLSLRRMWPLSSACGLWGDAGSARFPSAQGQESEGGGQEEVGARGWSLSKAGGAAHGKIEEPFSCYIKMRQPLHYEGLRSDGGG